MTAGAQPLASLTGTEAVAVDNGGATFVTGTTSQIAALAGTGTQGIVTTVSTVGAATLSAAAIIGKNINRTGVQTAAWSDTTDTAANIIAALPAGAPVGTSFILTISNNQTATTGYVETILGGLGVTVSGISTIATGQAVQFLVTVATASTVTMVGRTASQSGSALPISPPNAPVAATGSALASAAQVLNGVTLVTASDGTKCVKLPATPTPGAKVTLLNAVAAEPLIIFPDAAATINAIATHGALTCANGVPVELFATSATQWYSLPLVPS